MSGYDLAGHRADDYLPGGGWTLESPGLADALKSIAERVVLWHESPIRHEEVVDVENPHVILLRSAEPLLRPGVHVEVAFRDGPRFEFVLGRDGNAELMEDR